MGFHDDGSWDKTEPTGDGGDSSLEVPNCGICGTLCRVMDTANVGVRRGLAVLEISQCATEGHPCCLSSLPVGKAVDSGVRGQKWYGKKADAQTRSILLLPNPRHIEATCVARVSIWLNMYSTRVHELQSLFCVNDVIPGEANNIGGENTYHRC